MMPVQQLHKDASLRDLAARKTADISPPFYYHFHVHMPCNQKCIMCKPDGRHPRDVVPFDMFQGFVEKVRPYAEHITLIGGETLLYPWISEALALLAEAQVDVTICTNATQLNEKMISAMLPLKALNLRCSIDAATSETYFRIRGTNFFDRVTHNMRLFNEMTVDRPRLRQVLNYVVMQENLHEVVPFVDLAVSLSSDEVQFNPVRHVNTWEVENGTGWVFRGAEQSCESFRDEYNTVMKEAAAACQRRGVAYSVTLLR